MIRKDFTGFRTVNTHPIIRQKGSESIPMMDSIIVEEVLEIELVSTFNPRFRMNYASTMRTPGMDSELVAGILFTNGIIHRNRDIKGLKAVQYDNGRSKVLVYLESLDHVSPKLNLGNSSCGFCNSNQLRDILTESPFAFKHSGIKLDSDFIFNASKCLSEPNDHFNQTGGNHKICIMDPNGEKVLKAEDVGRHNAFDKIIGQALKKDLLPLKNNVAVISSRSSFEIVHKAWMSGIPILISLGAPTSKAIELADETGISLIGFAKSDRFNIYTHPNRIGRE